MDLRTEVGRFPRAGIPRRARPGAAEPGSQAAEPLLSRAVGALAPAAPRALRPRRRDRDRGSFRAGFRSAPAPDPSRGVADQAVGLADPRFLRRLRSAGARRRGPARGAPGRAAGAARGRPRAGEPAPVPDAGDARSGARAGLVLALR